MELQKLSLMLLPFLIIMYMPKANAQTSDDAKNLLYQIFNASGYNKAVRPRYVQTTPTDVTIDFHLGSIINFDSQKETLTTSGYLSFSWNDYYLQWTPETYGNLERIFIPQDNVWKPDISLLNGISELKGLGSNNVFVYVESDGNVTWDPPGIYESTCGIDITYFPFDIQTCDIIFGAWSYSRHEISVKKGTKGFNLDQYDENSEWSIVNTSVDTFEEHIDVSVQFSIEFKRKPLFFLLNVILPVILLSLLNVFIFVLPAESGEKASFSVTIFLALAVYLTIVATTLPRNSERVSILGIYLVLISSFSTIIVILTLFILRLNFRKVDEDPIPPWLIKVQVIVETIRCKRCNKVHPATQSQDEVHNLDSGYTVSTAGAASAFTESNSRTPDDKSKVTWNHICNALDFIFFWIFLLATVSTIVIIFFICTKHAV